MNKVHKSLSPQRRAWARLNRNCVSIVPFLSRQWLVLLVWLAGNLDPASLTAQPPALFLLDHDTAGTRLNVTNAYVANVNLEGSFNLADWFLLQSATPVLGVASFVHTNTEPVNAWFFRAVEGPAPRMINVGPQADLSQSGGALIFPETGGQLEITDANGVFYQLTVRSNLVTEPTAIRMTVITNFTDMPLTNRYRAAVVFEPDGLEFRGSAELKIRFPGPIPTLEMVGYGFDGVGGDFHLRPWESNTNEVTLAVSHFSGTGVAAEPFPLTGTPNQTYERGLTYTRDAIREADNWAGDQFRELSRSRHDGKITQAELLDSMASVKRLRDRLVFENAIAPLLAAAARDCAVGEAVMKRLDQLEGESSGGYGHGAFYKAILKVAPDVRCNCAHFYIDRCENDPSASGLVATWGLTETLQRIELATGVSGAQGCDLGSDDEIYAQLARGKCHKPWEGTVRYSNAYSSSTTNILSDSESSLTTVAIEQDDIAYVGHIAELLEEDGDVLDSGTWQSWTLKLDGKFTASRLESSITTYVSKDWTAIDSDVTKGLDYPPAEGELMIRFDNGLFTSVSASAGLGTNHYDMPLRQVIERKVECRAAGNCPDPIAPDTTDGSWRLSFADAPGVNTPNLVATWANNQLKVVLIRHSRDKYPDPSTGYYENTETLIVQLRRGSAP